MLDAHIEDKFKVASSTTMSTIGWNASMSLDDIFDQMTKMYGCQSPDTMRLKHDDIFVPVQPSGST